MNKNVILITMQTLSQLGSNTFTITQTSDVFAFADKCAF